MNKVWKTSPPPKNSILGVFTRSELGSEAVEVFWNGESWISKDGAKVFDYDPEYWMEIEKK